MILYQELLVIMRDMLVV